MSINMDGGGVEYADHEFQVITNQLQIGATAGEDNEAEILDLLDPVSSRGIDNDELAELVTMYRTFDMVDLTADATQTEIGHVEAEAGIGINLGQNEHPTQAAGTGPTNEERNLVVDSPNVTQNQGSNYSEPGALDATSGYIDVGFNEVADGTGGPGSGGVVNERFIDFRDVYGSGPYVDATDDISVNLELECFNYNGTATVESTYILAWNISEMPEGRASFARP